MHRIITAAAEEATDKRKRLHRPKLSTRLHTNKCHSDWSPCVDTSRNRRSIRVLSCEEWRSERQFPPLEVIGEESEEALLDRHSTVIGQQGSRIAAVDYRHCSSAGRDRPVTCNCATGGWIQTRSTG